VRAVVMVRLLMVPHGSVAHRSVPLAGMHVGEGHRWGSEPSYDENSKSLLENVFHGNPGGSVRLVSSGKRDAKPRAKRCADILAQCLDENRRTGDGRKYEMVQSAARRAWLRQGCSLEPLPRVGASAKSALPPQFIQRQARATRHVRRQ
jgi:hypothetical protein